MLVSAILDPAAFDADHFNANALYRIQAEDFLFGIEKNGVLILDENNRLRDALAQRIEKIPIKFRQKLQILIEELLLKKR